MVLLKSRKNFSEVEKHEGNGRAMAQMAAMDHIVAEDEEVSKIS